jgi:hypothetical protein
MDGQAAPLVSKATVTTVIRDEMIKNNRNDQHRR